MGSKLLQLKQDSEEFYKNLLGYKSEETSLHSIPNQQWNEFAMQRGLNPNSTGVYLPRNQTAIIQSGDELGLFHEYFGHGIYCERTRSGKKLVELEQELLKKEQEQFSKGQFTLEELSEFREQNPLFSKLQEHREQNLVRYESFAIWTEYLLSKENGDLEAFHQKYDSLDGQEKEFIDSVINFSKSYGDLATMYAHGMARRTTPERVRMLLENIYGIKAVKNSKLVLLTGGKKPFSDIDLFVSSNYLKSTKNNWLDLVAFDEEDFERRMRLFEVQLTLPIMEGEFIAGDKSYLQQKRRQLQEQLITEEAIRHNFEKSEKERIASEETNDEELKRVFSSYSKTYLVNAFALRGGIRLFTKGDLLSSL